MESFDDRAATWDDPANIARADVIAAAIRARVPVDRSTRLLEYGAGTGLVSQALSTVVGPITMADTSAGMREQMERKVAEEIIPGGQVWDLDLSDDAPLPEDRFDLVVAVLAMHHVENLDRALRAFSTLIDPDGRLCIVDLDREDGSFHGENVHVHDGFDRGEFGAQLEQAGFHDVAFETCHEIERNDRLYPLFLATATR